MAVWVDGENKYDIKTQGDVVIESDVKIIYKGTGGTALSSTNLNKIETGIDNLLINSLLTDLKLSLSSSNIDAWCDTFVDSTMINVAESEGYLIKSGSVSNLNPNGEDTTSGGSRMIGYDSSNQYAGQFFDAATSSIQSAIFYISKEGTPIDQLLCYLYDDTISTLIATSANVTIGTTGFYEFTFTPAVTVTKGTKYFAYIARTGSLSTTNYYSASYGGVGLYPATGYSGAYYNGSWGGLSREFLFAIRNATGIIIWNAVTASDILSKIAFAISETHSTGSVVISVSANGSSWTVLTANTMTGFAFTGTSVYIKAVLSGDIVISALAWGGR